MSGDERTPIPLLSVRGHRLAAYRYGSGASAIVLAHGILAHQDLPELRALARALSSDYSVYTLDFRGHGGSRGLFTLGREEHLDLGLLIEGLRSSHARIGIAGFSFGGFHSVLAAARHPVDSLALISAPAHLRLLDHFPFGRAYFRTLPHILRRRRGLPRVNPVRFPKLTPEGVIAQVSAPILIIHGTDDWIVSPRHARLLERAARTCRRVDLIQGGLHAEYLLIQDPSGMQERLRTWLLDTMG